MDSQINTTILVSNDEYIISTILGFFGGDEVLSVVQADEGAELIAIESPELVILDFTDWELGFAVLDKILQDPWLHPQSIITVCSSFDITNRIENHHSINLVSAIPHVDIMTELPKALSILRKNRAILFHRIISSQTFSEIVGACEIHNDSIEVECLINLICSYLYNANRLDRPGRNRLRMALMELFVNALEHGNCGIGFEEKSTWLSSGRTIQALIDEKLKDVDIAKRKIRFEYHIDDEHSTFRIIDEGAGFDWQPYLEKQNEDLWYLGVNGRGIVMAQTVLQSIIYNEKGNRVTCTISHKEVESNEIPIAFHGLNPMVFAPNEMLIKEGAASKYLYFIMKGRLEVTMATKHLSFVTPDDLFVGEISFLLTSKRTASVRAVTEVKAVRISREHFVKVIKEHPYYALFLARLLAQRVVKLNQEIAGVESVEL